MQFLFSSSSKRFIHLFTICFLLVLQHLFAGEDDGVSVYNYDGIPGCGCFRHCSCYSSLYGGSESSMHPKSPEDIVWHSFIKKIIKARDVAPYMGLSDKNLCAVLGFSGGNDLSMLSEYLDAIEKFKRFIEEEGDDNIKLWGKVYSSPKESEKLQEQIASVKAKIKASKEILQQIPDEIISLYKNILSSCEHRKSYNLALPYNEGLCNFHSGNYEDSLNKINLFIDFAEKSWAKEHLLNSRIYQKQGESFLEVGRYHDSIVALTKALEKDPKNKEAYFSRAAAYFETGNFDQAIQDYLSSEAAKEIKKVEPKVSKEFSSALLSGIFEGCKEAAVDFVPSLCSTAYGLGECLWIGVQHPVEATVNFCNACYEAGEAVVDVLKNMDKEKIEEISDEVEDLIMKFGNLSEAEKGNAIGHCIGKYGVDIFAGGAIVKCVSAVKKLKEANRFCNLEAMGVSEANRKTIVASAMKQSAEREEYFKNVKLLVDQQNKHIPGKHGYVVEKNRSIWTHSDPQTLLKEFAGKGIPKGRSIPGQPNYVERVDFNEMIGYYIHEDNPTLKLPTTKGIIKYAKKGAHIIPSHPDG